ncbi:MAG: alanine racemase [Microbacteriaceae bacterium]|nr:alanine racemase [Microbacteriaceae bacterium]
MSEPTPVPPRAEAVINLIALEHNVRSITQLVAPAELMLAVKANAYAHGLVPVAAAGLSAGAASLAVLEIPAGLALRAAGVTAPLLAWLHGTETDFRAGIEADIELGVSAVWQLEAIAASGANRPAVVHLKVDTGLSRNGATVEDWPELVRTALEGERAGLLRIRAAWSHLADASVADDEVALAAFQAAVAVAEGLGARFELLHLAASSAGIRMPEARFGLVRIGIAAYGISPFEDRTGAELGLIPVMSLRAPVIETRVGGSRLARVAAGYADGVPTLGIERASVLVNGVRCPVASVEVDSLLVDAGDARVDVGDVAIVFGAGDEGEPTAEEWADWAETIGDEIVTGVTPRVPRVYLR